MPGHPDEHRRGLKVAPLVHLMQHHEVSRGATAAAVSDYAIGEPRNGIVEIAGPERVKWPARES